MKRTTRLLALGAITIGGLGAAAPAQADNAAGQTCAITLTRSGSGSCTFTPVGATGTLALLVVGGSASAAVSCTFGNTSRSTNGAHAYNHAGNCTLYLSFNSGEGSGVASATSS